MAIAVGGRKRFRGFIEATLEADGVVQARLRIPADEKKDESVVDLPIVDMAEARLVLTEDLIRATLRREKAALKAAKAEAKAAKAEEKSEKKKPKGKTSKAEPKG